MGPMAGSSPTVWNVPELASVERQQLPHWTDVLRRLLGAVNGRPQCAWRVALTSLALFFGRFSGGQARLSPDRQVHRPTVHLDELVRVELGRVERPAPVYLKEYFACVDSYAPLCWPSPP